MRFLILTCALCGLVFSSASMAEKVYRWVDANGQTHFGNRAPDSNKAEEIDVKPLPTTALSPVKTKTQTEPQDSESETTYTVPASVTAAQAKQYCQDAKAQKQLLSSANNRRFKQADGSFRPFTDAERSNLLSKMDEMIQAYCH
ncbi:MAG: DUF4124 domain-containing protein [Venatoribacter sp.]